MERTQSFVHDFEKDLKPLYARLIDSVSSIQEEKYAYAAQWGEYYPDIKNQGLLFIGRATNHWHTRSLDLDVLFGDPNLGSTIFNCDDQMTWVYDSVEQHWDHYNTNRSAFWRVIRGVSSAFYPSGEELKHVAWSNVCKIQQCSGRNPYGRSYDLQIDVCESIFDIELKHLSPKFVIMLTGGYGEVDLLSHINGGHMPQPINTKNWGAFAVDVYQVNGTYFLCSEHPQGKEEGAHIECLVSLIKQYQ